MQNTTATPDSTKPAFMAEEVMSTPPSSSTTMPPTDPTPTTVNTSGGSHGKGKKIALAIFAVVLLVAATGTGIMLASNQQVSTTQAADCSRYNFTVTKEGVVTVINGSTQSVPPNTAVVEIDNTETGNFNIPSLSPGQSSQLGNVTVPESGEFTWSVSSTSVNCTDEGLYGTQTTSAAPLTTLAQCTGIQAFSTTWQALTPTQLSALLPGQRVRFTVSSMPDGSVDMAKFIINGVEQEEVSTKRPGTNDFYDEYVIPTGTTSFKIEAMVHHTESDTWY
jgi:hypothetical protein